MKTGEATDVLIGKIVVVLPRRSSEEASRCFDVNELKWPDALAFGRLLADRVMGFLTVNEAGQTVFEFAKLRDAIPASAELAEFLVTRATGLKPEDCAELRASEFVELLAVAMEVNLSEDVLGKFRRVGSIASRAFGTGTTPSPAPSTS